MFFKLYTYCVFLLLIIIYLFIFYSISFFLLFYFIFLNTVKTGKTIFSKMRLLFGSVNALYSGRLFYSHMLDESTSPFVIFKG